MEKLEKDNRENLLKEIKKKRELSEAFEAQY